MYTPPEVPNNLDFDELAKKFDGISGSDISNAMLNAAFKAARLKIDGLDKNLVFEAVENILSSKQANNENNKSAVSFHEIIFEAVENILMNNRNDKKEIK